MTARGEGANPTEIVGHQSSNDEEIFYQIHMLEIQVNIK